MVKGKPTEFRINFLSDSREYFAGGNIEGNVFLKLSKELVPVKSIIIQLSGMAKVKWHERGRAQEGSTKYKSTESICRLIWTIWRNEGSISLSAGQYEFPFKIQIPSDLALLSSFEGSHGVIRYSVIAGITRSQETKLKHTIAEGIIVKDIVNINVPHLMQPLSNFKQMAVQTFWHNYGSASLSVTINRGGFCPGEFIAVSVKAENQSTKLISAIHLSLLQLITYSGQKKVGSIFLFYNRQKQYHETRIIQRVEGSGIPAGQTGHWNNGLLHVPQTPPTTDGVHIINLSYAVNVGLEFHKADSLSLLIPVTIGTTPFRPQQTQYSTQQLHPYHSNQGYTPPAPYQF